MKSRLDSEWKEEGKREKREGIYSRSREQIESLNAQLNEEKKKSVLFEMQLQETKEAVGQAHKSLFVGEKMEKETHRWEWDMHKNELIDIETLQATERVIQRPSANQIIVAVPGSNGQAEQMMMKVRQHTACAESVEHLPSSLLIHALHDLMCFLFLPQCVARCCSGLPRPHRALSVRRRRSREQACEDSSRACVPPFRSTEQHENTAVEKSRETSHTEHAHQAAVENL